MSYIFFTKENILTNPLVIMPMTTVQIIIM